MTHAVRNGGLFLLAVSGLAAVACSDGRMMTGPNGGPGTGLGGSTTLLSVSPAGHAVAVPLTTPLTVRFSQPMAAGMEQFVDLHMGDPSGPMVPLHFAWSADHSTLTCVPDEPLHARTQYALHLGGGLVDEHGHGIDMDEHGHAMGGDWLFAAMMNGHGGRSWSMMGGAWHGANGSYGMFFSFTTS